jgi:4-amino-4-deoxy-L-arabinose transferase-like glycosyltransferase
MTQQERNRAGSDSGEQSQGVAVILLLAVFCFFVFLYHLGGLALFEPDEGRNAEKAREILLIHEWVTPLEDFMPVLDKPMFFYWLIALSYKAFGVSEWSARLPSALAGLGTALVIFLLVIEFRGRWSALWSTLVMVSSLEFFLLSRTVIFDMVLTFFVTLSLSLFLHALHSDQALQRRSCLFLMYASAAAAALVKGPIGIILPGMVIFVYLALTRSWRRLRELHLFTGALIVLLIVTPWYLWVEMKNPGYLRYFILEENFLRFLTPHFNRTRPWYYFFLVLGVGFLPWSLVLPHIVYRYWQRPPDDFSLFMVLWAALPFLFFSLSGAKLPHYILPIFPALAVLVGDAAAGRIGESAGPKRWPLWLTGLQLLAVFMTWLFAALRPTVFPEPIQAAFEAALRDISWVPLAAALLSAFAAAAFFRRLGLSRNSLYALCCCCFLAVIYLMRPFMSHVSLASSSKELAARSLEFIRPDDQIVVFDTYVSSLPFYLKVSKPFWIIWSGKKDSVWGSFYLAEQARRLGAQHAAGLLTFDEFTKEQELRKNRLMVFVKEKNLGRAFAQIDASPEILLRQGEFVLATRH